MVEDVRIRVLQALSRVPVRVQDICPRVLGAWGFLCRQGL